VAGPAWGGGRALRGSVGMAGQGEAGCGSCLAFASALGGDLRGSAAAAPTQGLSVVHDPGRKDSRNLQLNNPKQ
jgi:hypothetical protein